MRQQHKPLKWISENFCFPDSAGKQLARKPVGPYLLPFQKRIIKEVFTPKGDIKNNIFVYGCRKVGKSLMWSMLIWYLINDKKRRGYRMPVMASVFAQAKLIYEQLICQKFKKSDIRFYLETIKQKNTKARVDFFANTAGSVLGQESDGLCADEISAYKNDTALLNLTTGGSLSPDTFLKLYSSNPAMTDDHFVIDFVKSCDADPTFKVHRFMLPAKADWTKEENWAIANPFLKEFFRSKGKRFSYVMRFYRDYFNRALKSKSEEIAFRRYLLGQFCSGEQEYIDLNRIRECDEQVFKDTSVRWALGCDYSVTHDFTAVSLVGWSQSRNKIYVKPFLFLPNTNRRRETQKRMFETWEKAGYLTIQRKEVLDGEQVAEQVISYLSERNIVPEAVVMDKALSQHHIESFADYKVLAIRMTGREMTGGIRELERVGADNGLNFIGRNDCLKWMMGNVCVSSKSKNFVLMNRINDMQNIDGPVSISLAMKFFVENKPKQFLIMSG